MIFSYSRVSKYNICPYAFKLKYIDQLEIITDPAADDPRIVGSTIHKYLELGKAAAFEYYEKNFYIFTNKHIEELIKIEHMAELTIAAIKESDIKIYKKELNIQNENFKGIIDLVILNDDKTLSIYDYKYSNNQELYIDSMQLHIYQYYLEKQGYKIKDIGFIFIPKIHIRQKKDENLLDFRKRINDNLKAAKIQVVKVNYDEKQVNKYFDNILSILSAKKYEKNKSGFCRLCEYKTFCEEGLNYMLLPQNQRRELTKNYKKKLWIYGPPFSGKTTFVNKFPNPLMLNTDGNIKFVDAPYIAIKDIVTVNGRITERKFAWEILKEAITELEKKENDFETIIVDLLEDCYEYCRLYMFNKLNIEHESDDSFKAWDKVRTEFLSTLKRLLNLDYNIVLLSHEDISKDITKKNGDKITSVTPNLKDKVANKIAGMVDACGRVVVDENNRKLSFKHDSVIFGGGRCNFNKAEIDLNYESLEKIYDDFNNTLKDPTETPAADPEAENKSRRRRV